MDLADALTILDQQTERIRGKALDPLEKAIITAAWQRTQYRDIGEYAEQTLKNRSSKLWRELSKVIGTNVNKNNLKLTILGLDLQGKFKEIISQDGCVVWLAIAGSDRSFRSDRFDLVVWISLDEIPADIDVVIDTLDRLCARQIKLPINDPERAIGIAIDYLQNRRCAILLECESIEKIDLSLLQKYRLLGDRLNRLRGDRASSLKG